MAELKPCPFCGGAAKFETGLTGNPRVWCSVCRCNTAGHKTVEEAILCWNRRTKDGKDEQKPN